MPTTSQEQSPSRSPRLVDVHHLIGPHEIAQMLGVTRQRVTQLAEKPDFPRPVVVLKMGKVWHTEEVQAWAERTGRTVRPL